MEVAADIALIALLMVVFAALIALIATPFSLLLSLVRGGLERRNLFSGLIKAFPATPGGITNYLLLFATCSLFVRLLKVWFAKLNHGLPVESYFIGLLLAILIYWRNRSNFHERVDRLVGLLTRRLLPALCVVALILVGWRAGTETSRRHLEAGELAKQTKMLSGKGRPDIILITFDALTAEDMSLYGYHLKTTPNIEEFAKQCYVFDNTIAAANWTRPCVTSLLTGKYPDKHRMINTAQTNNVNLYPQENLPAILKKDGYSTVSLSANSWAGPIANGTAAFFDINKFDLIALSNIPFYEYIPTLLSLYGSTIADKFGIRSILWLSDFSRELFAALPERAFFLKQYTRPFYPPELVFDRASEHLGDASKLKLKPLFLWTHLLIPHAPYLPAKPAKSRFSSVNDLFFDYAYQRPYYSSEYAPDEQPNIDRLRLHYDENILYGDEAFGKYIRILKQSGRLDDSIVIVSADHGESFSHGFQGHGGALLYQPLVHIPLLIHLPGQEKGRRLASTVSQTDIAPTILDLLGYAVPAWMDGRSLKEAMGGKQLADRPVFSMNLDGIPIRGNIAKGNAAVISGGYKYVIYGKLYDLRNDPEEKNNLADLEPDRMQAMHQMILDRIESK